MDIQPQVLRVVLDEGLSMNITSEEAAGYGTTLTVLGVALTLCSLAMIIYTALTPTPDSMKRCEKLVICNVLVPDLLLGAVICKTFGPAVFQGRWSHGQFVTRWLAFLHTCCVFHPQLAIAFICYIISISLNDVYRFESANNMKFMSALVLCSICLTACFCSLPATEMEGFVFSRDWLGPWFNLHYQYGSTLMLISIVSLTLLLDVVSVVMLFKAKNKLKKLGSKVSKKAFADVTKIIIFCLLQIFCLFLTLPAACLVEGTTITLVARVPVYLLPMVRMLSLLKLCPHFQFGRGRVTDDQMDEFTKLADIGDSTGMTSAQLEEMVGSDDGEEVEKHQD